MKKIIIFGFGSGGKQAFQLLSSSHTIVAICDSKKQAIREYLNVPVILPTQIPDFDYDRIIVASMYVSKVMAVLQNIGVNEEKIDVYETVRILIDKRLKDAERLIHNKQANIEHGTALGKLLNQPADAMLPEEWCLLYDYLIANMQFDKGLMARDKTLTAYQKTSPCEDRMLALLDMGLFDEAKSELRKISLAGDSRECGESREAGNNDPGSIESLSALLNLYSGSVALASRDIAQRNITSQNKQALDFSALINGRTIAVVGPCLANDEQGKQIDECDLVVRLSPSVINETEYNKLGSRTDIVYVGAHAPVYMLKENMFLLKRDDVFYVFESIITDSQEQLVTEGRARKMEFQIKLFNGFPNFLQRILIDLLLLGAGRIKIFNFDFYTGKQAYGSHYKNLVDRKKFSSRPKNHLLQSQAVLHDFASQFNFCKIIMEKDVIDADTKGRTILGMTLVEYFMLLEEAFS